MGQYPRSCTRANTRQSSHKPVQSSEATGGQPRKSPSVLLVVNTVETLALSSIPMQFNYLGESWLRHALGLTYLPRNGINHNKMTRPRHRLPYLVHPPQGKPVQFQSSDSLSRWALQAVAQLCYSSLRKFSYIGLNYNRALAREPSPQTYSSCPYCGSTSFRRGSQPIASIVDASTCTLCFTKLFYREWKSLPSTMPNSALHVMKWLKHCKWQTLDCCSVCHLRFLSPFKTCSALVSMVDGRLCHSR